MQNAVRIFFFSPFFTSSSRFSPFPFPLLPFVFVSFHPLPSFPALSMQRGSIITPSVRREAVRAHTYFGDRRRQKSSPAPLQLSIPANEDFLTYFSRQDPKCIGSRRPAHLLGEQGRSRDSQDSREATRVRSTC